MRTRKKKRMSPRRSNVNVGGTEKKDAVLEPDTFPVGHVPPRVVSLIASKPELLWDSITELLSAMATFPQVVRKRVGTMTEGDLLGFVKALQEEKGFAALILLERGQRVVLASRDGVCDLGVTRSTLYTKEGEVPPPEREVVSVDVDFMSTALNIQWFDEEIGPKIHKFDEPDTEREPVYVVVSNGMSLDTNELGNLGTEFEKRNYDQKVIQQFDSSVREMNSDRPTGRLHVLEGPPGTGKSYFIRGLVQECPTRKFLLLFGEMLSGITYPGLLELLMDNFDRGVRLALVVEDADKFITPRMADNVSHVSTLLNATDGLLGEALDLHVVVSTNQKKTEIDEALQRPGRLCEHIRFNPLPPAFATARCNELRHSNDVPATNMDPKIAPDPEPFTKNASIAEIYERARIGQVPSTESKTIGFKPDVKPEE